MPHTGCYLVASGTDNDFAFSPLLVGAQREQVKFIVNGIVKNQAEKLKRDNAPQGPRRCTAERFEVQFARNRLCQVQKCLKQLLLCNLHANLL